MFVVSVVGFSYQKQDCLVFLELMGKNSLKHIKKVGFYNDWQWQDKKGIWRSKVIGKKMLILARALNLLRQGWFLIQFAFLCISLFLTGSRWFGYASISIWEVFGESGVSVGVGWESELSVGRINALIITYSLL